MKMIAESGLEYYETLPEDYILMENFLEMFCLKPGTKEKTVENMILRDDLKLIIFNPQSKEYYPRYLHLTTDRKLMKKYFDDKNLYINSKALIWSK